MDPRFLKWSAIGIGFVCIAVVATVFLYPDSVFSAVLDRFQTLFTGILAGLTALVTGGLVYRAAKLPIEAERARQAERRREMRIAGAAQLLSLCNGIRLAVISEAGKAPADRRKKLVVPESLPSLETIGTQDDPVIHVVSEFLASASRIDAHTVLENWPYDPENTDPRETAAFADLADKWATLERRLKDVASGQSSPA